MVRVSGVPGLWTELSVTPSIIAKPDRLKQLQTEGDKPFFLMHRPPDAQAIPFALLHDDFGYFKDVQAGLHGTPDPVDYQFTVELCHVASQFYDSEADRRDAVTTVLTWYLKCKFARFNISLGGVSL
ncbi:hypothetical protein WJX75_007492 [Coccomyxa subellipsoidea]|uniref:Uncharacterized protein n=1 Tax=Coccomyxa subellipsoidea TaxID=248742 RepID=A0ABR2Z3S5_9CHLO